MVIQVDQIEDEQIYVASTGFTGVLPQFPAPFVGFQRNFRDRDSVWNILGLGPTVDYAPVYSSNYNTFRDFKGKTWPIAEQISYFLDPETYAQWDAPIREPRFMDYDIEVGTSKGRSPDHNRDPIIMIGAGFNDEPPVIFDRDREIDTIMDFFEFIRNKDPDVMVGYFSKGFDGPYLLGRILKLKAEFPSWLHRVPVPKRYFRNPNGYLGLFNEITSPAYEHFGFGRTSFDVFESSVKLDTTITTKNRRMKTVGQFFKIPDIVDLEDDQKGNMLEIYLKDREKLQSYLPSDIRITTSLRKHYLPQIALRTQLVRSTLGYILNAKGRAAFARTYITKAFISHGVFPILRNSSRNRRTYAMVNGGYQGAFTGIRQTGRFFNTSKIDFAGMYPSIMYSFNISPDTITFMGKSPLRMPDKIVHEMDKWIVQDNYYPSIIHENTDEHIILSVPDERAKGYVKIRIDRTKKGIIPSEIERLFNMRAEVRKKMEKYEKEDQEYKMLNSEQTNIKIALNSLYGIMGNEHMEIADITSALIVTAIGRELSHYCTAKTGTNTIEIDTDGIYIDGDFDSVKLNNELRVDVESKYGKFPFPQRLIIEMEKTGMESLFLGMKTYMLRDPATGIMSTTGAALKGSSKSKYVEEILQLTAQLLLDRTDPDITRKTIQEKIDGKWKNTDFKISMAVRKELDEYDSDGGMFHHLSYMMEQCQSDEPPKPAFIRKYLETCMRKELIQLEKSFTKAFTKKGQVEIPEFPLKPEAVLTGWLNSVSGMNDGEQICKYTEYYLIEVLGKIPTRGMSMNYKVYLKAVKAGIQVLKGDSIEYYYALSEDKEEIFTTGNLARYPMDMSRYKEQVKKTAQKMIDVVSAQGTETLF